MIQRLKNLWKLSSEKELVDRLYQQIQDNAAHMNHSMPIFKQGDGKAEFLSDFTDEEYEEYQEDQKGWGDWFKRLIKR